MEILELLERRNIEVEDKTVVSWRKEPMASLNNKKETKREKDRTVVSWLKETMVYLTSKTAAQTARLPCALESSWMFFPRKLFREAFVQNFVFQYYSYLAESVIVEMHTILLSNMNNWKTPFCKVSITPAFKFSSLPKFTIDRCVPVYLVIVDVFFESLEFGFGGNAGGYSNDKNCIRNVIKTFGKINDTIRYFLYASLGGVISFVQVVSTNKQYNSKYLLGGQTYTRLA